MTVTVTSKDRYYYVSGEVKNPGTKPYLGETDILKAISSASDFTDFAKRTKVQINRANGKKETIDATKAIEDPKQNVPVYPGDHIFVPRRFF
jgi:polysaccharide export outer membrane protein